MTQKEFKAVLENAGMNFEVWGWEGILNIIACDCKKTADDCRQEGFNSLADSQDRIRRIIITTLMERGFYNTNNN